MIPYPPPKPEKPAPSSEKPVPAGLETWLSSCEGVLTFLYLHDAIPARPRQVREILPHVGMDGLPRGYRLLLAKLNALTTHGLCEIHWIKGAKCFQLSPAGKTRVPAARLLARKFLALLAPYGEDSPNITQRGL